MSNNSHKRFAYKRRQRDQTLPVWEAEWSQKEHFFFFFKDKSYCTMFYVDRNDSVNRDTVKREGMYTQSKKVLD